MNKCDILSRHKLQSNLCGFTVFSAVLGATNCVSGWKGARSAMFAAANIEGALDAVALEHATAAPARP